jgi:FkbM family methyltransferase
MLTIRELLRRRRDPIYRFAWRRPKPPPRKIIHVGAHLAQERFKYEQLGYTGILWVEGSPATAKRLREVIAGHSPGAGVHHVIVEAIATDDDSGTAELREVSNAGASTSLFPLTDSAAARWGVHETGVVESAPTRTIDSIAKETGFADADVLLVDVQGAELLVLKGATSLLARVRAVITEISQEPMYQGGVLLPELSAFLAAHGFRPAMRAPKRHGDLLFVR